MNTPQEPYRKLPKPVYIHGQVQPELLASNKALFDWWHLTSHYFYQKDSSGKYIKDYVDPKRFNDTYLSDPEKCWQQDANHPTHARLAMLDLEHYRVDATWDPDWWEQTGQYRRICQMHRASGHDVSVYGIDGGWAREFQVNWNIYRFEIDRPDEKKLKAYRAKEQNVRRDVKLVADRFRDVLDYAVINLYWPGRQYAVPNDDAGEPRYDSFQYQAFLYHVEQKIALRAEVFPDKPLIVVVQPNYTGKPDWKPIQADIFNSLIETLNDDDRVNSIALFTLANYRGQPVVQDPGWDDHFRAVPQDLSPSVGS